MADGVEWTPYHLKAKEEEGGKKGGKAQEEEERGTNNTRMGNGLG